MNDRDRTPTIDEVLNEIAALPTPPARNEFRSLIERYPKFKREITDFVTSWIEMEWTLPRHEMSEVEAARIVNVTMSQIQAVQREELRSWEFQESIARSGLRLEDLEARVGIDRTILTSLQDRLIRPETIPDRLVEHLARVLRTSTATVLHYLSRPPLAARAYCATNPPKIEQIEFCRAVRDSELSSEMKRFWIAEIRNDLIQWMK